MNPISGVPVVVDYLLASAQILGAVAWPVVVLVVLWSFRKPIRNALQALVELRFGSTTLKFDRAGGDVALSVVASVTQSRAQMLTAQEPKRPALRDLYATLAEENPASAILKGYGAIEEWLAENLPSHGIPNRADNRARSAMDMTEEAVQKGVLPESALQQLGGLSVMRNLTVHKRRSDEVTVENAHEFLTLADAVIFTFSVAVDNKRLVRE